MYAMLFRDVDSLDKFWYKLFFGTRAGVRTRLHYSCSFDENGPWVLHSVNHASPMEYLACVRCKTKWSKMT